jgi:microcystin-dependent protein
MTNVATLQTAADLSASITAQGVSALMPTGTVLHFAGSSAPTGWLLCDGSAVSRTTYATLFALLSTTYGVGDGSTTFNVPNTSGIFISGVGSQTISSIAYTRTLATRQGDVMQGHDHNVKSPDFVLPFASDNGANGNGARLDRTAVSGLNYWTTPMIALGANGTPRLGTETRPANIAFNHIIKI